MAKHLAHIVAYTDETMLRSAMNGYDAVIFAYGMVTSSRKRLCYSELTIFTNTRSNRVWKDVHTCEVTLNRLIVPVLNTIHTHRAERKRIQVSYRKPCRTSFSIYGL